MSINKESQRSLLPRAACLNGEENYIHRMYQNMRRWFSDITSGDNSLEEWSLTRLLGGSHSRKDQDCSEWMGSYGKRPSGLFLFYLKFTCILNLDCIYFSLFSHLTEKGQELWIFQKKKTSRCIPQSCVVMGHLFI